MSDKQLLHTLTPTELEALENLGEPATFAAEATIFAEGEASDRVLVVRRVRVAARTRSGAEVELARRGIGELLGDLSGIDGQPRSASVVALAGVVVSVRAFRGFLRDHPRAALALLEVISRRLREADARRVEAAG